MIKIKRRRQGTADECGTQGLCAIVHVLQIVEATALAVLQVFVDCQAEEEETLEQMREVMDDVVDTGHGVNDGEDFNFDGNNVDL